MAYPVFCVPLLIQLEAKSLFCPAQVIQAVQPEGVVATQHREMPQASCKPRESQPCQTLPYQSFESQLSLETSMSYISPD